MLGDAGATGSVAHVLGGYEALLDDYLGSRTSDDSGDVNVQWIGTEEDILREMMQRETQLFAPIRSGVI